MEKAITKDFPLQAGTWLGITSVGRSDTMAGHKYGPAVRPYYLIHYILAGSGTFVADNVTYHLHAGQGFLIEPNYRTTYIADKDTPWSYVWMGFAGKGAAELVEQLAVTAQAPVFNSPASYELADCVNRVLAIKKMNPAGNLRALSQLFRFLSYIADATVSGFPLSPAMSHHNRYIDQATQYIQNHLTTVSVSSLAKAVNLNRSYLTDLFKANLGMTPSEYIRNFRITKARHLLESSTLRVDQVADRCGYQHTKSFARSFKQTYGVSPRKYRQQKDK